MKSQLEHQQEQNNIEFMPLDVDDVSSERPVDVEDLSEEYDRPPSRYSITSYGADYPVDALVERIRNNGSDSFKFSTVECGFQAPQWG